MLAEAPEMGICEQNRRMKEKFMRGDLLKGQSSVSLFQKNCGPLIDAIQS